MGDKLIYSTIQRLSPILDKILNVLKQKLTRIRSEVKEEGLWRIIPSPVCLLQSKIMQVNLSIWMSADPCALLNVGPSKQGCLQALVWHRQSQSIIPKSPKMAKGIGKWHGATDQPAEKLVVTELNRRVVSPFWTEDEKSVKLTTHNKSWIWMQNNGVHFRILDHTSLVKLRRKTWKWNGLTFKSGFWDVCYTTEIF